MPTCWVYSLTRAGTLSTVVTLLRRQVWIILLPTQVVPHWLQVFKLHLRRKFSSSIVWLRLSVKSTCLHINGSASQSDTSKAIFHAGGESTRFLGDASGSPAGAGTGVTNEGGTAGTFDVAQIVLQAHRMISTTFLDNHIDEEILVNLLPMMTENVTCMLAQLMT